uniref:NADH-ubiquinone oxidoreductase chain 6 n=1 Tax=Incoltorrida madagassica TaxID=442089 RepID=A0A343A3L8_9COLE|nr:NADH dehydrogenase subunit 6 [Incoltorrida madagassica]AOY39146.1 NADH dehydrogenase subunit 6 [Incoltorrida madagassica]
MMLMMMMISIMFLFMNHPLSMGFTLLMQTLMISLMLGFYSYSYWFSYMLFLIMIGGMMILFMYMTSLASNEKFFISNKMIFIMITMMIFFVFLMLIYYNTNLSPMYKIFELNIFNNYIFMNNEYLMINKIYNYPNQFITIFIFNYLFLTLIACIKIININKGPLRQMN